MIATVECGNRTGFPAGESFKHALPDGDSPEHHHAAATTVRRDA